jgi:hypothetical protein
MAGILERRDQVNRDWRIRGEVTDTSIRTATELGMAIAVLMDLRDRLDRLVAVLQCPNMLGIPAQLRRIEQNTRRPKRARRGATPAAGLLLLAALGATVSGCEGPTVAPTGYLDRGGRGLGSPLVLPAPPVLPPLSAVLTVAGVGYQWIPGTACSADRPPIPCLDLVHTAVRLVLTLRGGALAEVAWSYGDGAEAIGSSPTTSHGYALAGAWTARAVALDDNGRTVEASALVQLPAPCGAAPSLRCRP